MSIGVNNHWSMDRGRNNNMLIVLNASEMSSSEVDSVKNHAS